MKRDISLYVKDISDSISKIEEYTKGVNKDTFHKDTKLQDAVVRRIEIMGEATKHIPANARQKYPDVPWKDIAGMRDLIIHHYDVVDPYQVWKVAKEDISKIKPLIQKLYEDLKKNKI